MLSPAGYATRYYPVKLNPV